MWHGMRRELLADDHPGRKRTQNCEGNGEEKPGFKKEVAE